MSKISKVFQSLKDEGLKTCWYKAYNHINIGNPYEKWMKLRENKEDIVPTETSGVSLYKMELKLDENQGFWEQLVKLKENISNQQSKENLYIYFVKEQDKIEKNYTSTLMRFLSTGNYDFVYTDEDCIDASMKRRNPEFKPDFSPDTLLSYNYIQNGLCMSANLFLKVCEKGEVDNLYDLVLKACEETSKIGHISEVLYHKNINRIAKNPTKWEEKSLEHVVKEEALKRRGLSGKLEHVQEINEYNIVYTVKEEPLVSIIIPSKDNFDILLNCIKSIRENTKYRNYELIVVDNGSCNEVQEKVEALKKEIPFQYIYEKRNFNFSYMCNLGAAHSLGEYYLFLNDDISIPKISSETDWLTRFVGQAMQDHTGAVGCKLLYPESELIQHCGVMNSYYGPDHSFHHMSDKSVLYGYRNRLTVNAMAVTAAAMLISKDKFEMLGGFLEKYEVAYNDVDLCLRLVEKGYVNVVRNDITLIHYESISRGSDVKDCEKAKRAKQERDLLFQDHSKFKFRDPFYNENLTKIKVDYSIDCTPYWCETSLRENTTKVEDYEVFHMENENVEYEVEAKLDTDKYYLSGFAFDKKKMKPVDVKILVQYEDGTSKIATSKKIYRKDIASIYNSKGVAFSGFYFQVKNDMKKEIKRYLLINNKKIEL